VEPRLLVTADALPGSVAETALLAAVIPESTLSTVLAMRMPGRVACRDPRVTASHRFTSGPALDSRDAETPHRPGRCGASGRFGGPEGARTPDLHTVSGDLSYVLRLDLFGAVPKNQKVPVLRSVLACKSSNGKGIFCFHLCSFSEVSTWN
jgi:hypothetical protein